MFVLSEYKYILRLEERSVAYLYYFLLSIKLLEDVYLRKAELTISLSISHLN